MRLQQYFIGFLICCLSTLNVSATNSAIVINQHKLDLHPVLLKDSFLSRTFYLLQFNQSVVNLNKSLFIERGFQIVEQFSDHMFIVYVDRAFQVDSLWTSFDLHAAIFTPQLKTTDDLYTSGSKQSEKLLIKFVSSTNQALLQAALQRIGASDIQFLTNNLLACTLPLDKIKIIVGKDFVVQVQLAAQDRILNYTEKANLHAIGLSYNNTFNTLDGSGVTIGIGDNASGMYHADTKNRIINYNTFPIANHGQHTTGTVLGNGILFQEGMGMAPNATGIAHNFSNVWNQTALMRQTHGMSITNNSYSARVGNCAYAGLYDLYSYWLDEMTITYPDVIHVFAAGNDANLNCTPYSNGFATVQGSYQSAKNPLVVAGVNANNYHFWLSSKGPTRDGRMKPEITAVGQDVFSSIPTDNYLQASGTSMACPQVAGGIALVTQRYKQLFPNQLPSSDLLKALVLNSATDIGNKGPDFVFGFGLFNVKRALIGLDSNRYVKAILNKYTTHNHSISVPAGVAKLKVLICWNDTLKSSLAPTTLANDLNLKLIAPTATTYYPLILNPNSGLEQQLAQPGIDHLNNVEQVVIENPVPGNYTASVDASTMLSTKQAYSLTYQFSYNQIAFTFPYKNAPLLADTNVYIYWDGDLNNPQTIKIQYSTDYKQTWTTIDSNVAALQYAYNWRTPNINNDHVFIRILDKNNNLLATTDSFLVHSRLELKLDSNQCPGAIKIHWNAIASATQYKLLLLQQGVLKVLDSTNQTNFEWNGLSTDSTYYIAVVPTFADKQAYRSAAIKVKPNFGDCIGFTKNDIAIYHFLSPTIGRVATSTEFRANQLVRFSIQNRAITPLNNFKISYKVDNANWQINSIQQTVPSGDTLLLSIPITGLQSIGSHMLRVAITNTGATDSVPQNDTSTIVLRQIQNNPISLPFEEDFETTASNRLLGSHYALSSNERFDFETSAAVGQLSTFINDSLLIDGTRSMHLDAQYSVQSLIKNTLQATFNCAAFTNQEYRFDFDYYAPSKFSSKNNFSIFARAADTLNFSLLYVADSNLLPGVVYKSPSFSLSALSAAGFTSSLQIKIDQFGSTSIAGKQLGSGLVLDNFRIYTVTNDVQLTKISTPKKFASNLSANQSIAVEIKNESPNLLPKVFVYYNLDGGLTYKDSVINCPARVPMVISLSKLLDCSRLGAHTLNVWVEADGDSYPLNDSILNYTFIHQPLFASFPYIENFEKDFGNYYAYGTLVSWKYGTISSPNIPLAASGRKAWKTNLNGFYNNSEYSYLQFPFFNTSSLQQPMLSFSMLNDIENCGSQLCDGAWLEYSTNGIDWLKLGSDSTGFNWYQKPFALFNKEGDFRWKVASIDLPKASSLQLRMVFSSDEGYTLEGIAIDDIHIFDKIYAIKNVQNTVAITKSTSTSPILFTDQNKVFSALQLFQPVATSITASAYHQAIKQNNFNQYFLPISFLFNAGLINNDSMLANLYVRDSDFLTLLKDTNVLVTCKPSSIYTMGVSTYDAPGSITTENANLLDNNAAGFDFKPFSQLSWVPYDSGYFVQVPLQHYGELWIHNGGCSSQLGLLDSLKFTCTATLNSLVKTSVKWNCSTRNAVKSFTIQRSLDKGVSFETIQAMLPANQDMYIDSCSFVQYPKVYYRVVAEYENGNSDTSTIDSVQVNSISTETSAMVFPNPTTTGKGVNIRFLAFKEAISISVINAIGQVVFQDRVSKNQLTNLYSIDLRSYSAGLYSILIETKEYKQTTKLLVN